MTQPNGRVSSARAVVTIPNQITMVEVRSVPVSRRTVIMANAMQTAEPKANAEPRAVSPDSTDPPMCGDRMMRMPTKPTTTADQR